MRSTRLCISCVSLLALVTAGSSVAADKKSSSSSSENETIAKPMSAKEKRKKEEKLRKELETPYRKWLNEDVAYIITDEERAAFKRLQTDEEREQFIEQFWLRRDPTPDTVENEFKEEHYRRIAYANEHFASGIPGWKTDRGRIYITFGPPDEIDSHPSGGTYERPPEEGGGETSTFPFEDWRYRYIEGIGTNIMIEFVDPTMSGEYRMTMDPSEKDALLYVPGAGLTLMEQMGLSDKTDRFNRTDGTHLGVPFGGETADMDEFNRLEQFAKLQKPPAVKFKDLESEVNSRITYNILPMKVREDFFPVTDASVLANVTLQFNNKDLQFSNKDGVDKATVNIFGRITTMTRRIVNTFEDTVSVDAPPTMLQAYSQQKSIYQKTIPLAPGTYRLNVVAKDVVGGNMTNYEAAITVPRLDPDKATTSTLVLADLIEKVPTRSIGTGQFVIGTTKVRPRVDDTFKQDEKMGIYLKLYNLGEDETTHKPSGQVQYEVVKGGSNDAIFNFTEDLSKIPGASASQVTIEKLLPLKTLAPGKYTLRLKITDKDRNQVLTPSAQFTVI
ncbi:MAG TPA: GWxTD domain-containing protein [Bryobacteraceae bacterium]|nr:GWxTD domain-containing protein [Bryobacteraceae bacterium]